MVIRLYLKERSPTTITMKNPLRLLAFAIAPILFSGLFSNGHAQVSITCPADITVGNDPGTCEAVVTYTEPVGTGTGTNITTTLTAGLPSGSLFPVGTTVVEYTVTNDEGDSDSCTFSVTVNDTEAPDIDCPIDITVDADPGTCNQVVNFEIPDATDNCGPVTVIQIGGLPSGSAFPVGENFLDFQTTDAAGNNDFCRVIVFVNDIDEPELVCPDDITLTVTSACDTVVNYTAPTGTDLCLPSTTVQTGGLGPGSVFPVGTTTETYQATDLQGNTATCSFDITILDGAPPVFVDCPADISQVAPAPNCEDVVTFPTPSATDNCPGVVVTQTAGLSSGSSFPVGITTVEFTATDASGNTAICSFDVTITEDVDPEITCPGDIVVDNDPGECGAVVTYSPPVGTDNCPSPITSLISGLGSGATFPIGTTTETYEVTDASGNTADCSFTVTVIDAEAPVVDCPGDIATTADPGVCETTVTFATPAFTDNCPGGTITQTIGPASGSSFPVGSTLIEFTAEDDAGNQTLCSFNIIVNDAELPLISCPPDIDITIESGACDTLLTYPDPTLSDNCPEVTFSVLSGPASGTTLSAGSYSVTLQAIDASGNTAECSFNIDIADNNNPVFDCPGDIVVDADPGLCETIVTFEDPTATDPCSNVTVSQTGGLPSGSSFPVGTSTIEYTAEDEFGNIEVCSFDIIVEDNEDPTVTCPDDILTVNDPGLCGATVTFDAPVADDNCGIASITLIEGLPSGDFFPAGTTTVSFEVSDPSGNTAVCSFNVVVADDEDPTLTCPADIEINAGLACSVVVDYDAPTASDNCGVASVNLIEGLASGSEFPAGVTVVSFEAIDDAGNTTTCSFAITVTEDGLPTIECPDNLSVPADPGVCAAIVNYDLPTAEDDCSEVTLTLIEGPATGEEFQVGTTTVSYQAEDGSGNTATCSFEVTVSDEEPPVFDCPEDISIPTDPGICGAVFDFDLPQATDNCTPDLMVTQTAGPASGSQLALGSTTLGFETSDEAGNTSTCSFTVTVNDSEPPVFDDCPEDILIELESFTCDSAVTFPAPTATDVCGATVEQTEGPNSGESLAPGTYTVEFTATDAAGNTATCAFQIEMQDLTPPVITCPESFESCDVIVELPLPEAADSCGIASLIQIQGPESGSSFPVGISEIVFEATDVNGNTSTCSYEVEVLPQTTRPETGPDNNICDETTVFLNGNTPEFGLGLWYQIEGEGDILNPESPTTQVNGLAVGTNVFVWSIDPDNGCDILTDTTAVIVEEGVVAEAGSDQTMFLGGDAPLFGSVNPPDGTISWDPSSSLSCSDCLNPIATPQETTQYFLTYTSPLGCSRTDSVTVKVFIELPNTITPDGDGVNDTWNIPEIADFPDVAVKIFNRWGIEVFSSVGYNEPWDGTRDGEDLPTGSYYYVIDYNEEGKENLNGTVNIIR